MLWLGTLLGRATAWRDKDPNAVQLRARRPDDRRGTNKGGFTLQGSSDLSAGRTRANAVPIGQHLPNHSLIKVGWYAGAIASVALLALLPGEPFGSSLGVDMQALRSAFVMVTLGVSLATTVTVWNPVGGRVRPDTRTLIQALIGIGVLSAANLVIASLSLSGTGADTAIPSVLQPGSGMGLTIATGMLAASYLPDEIVALSRNQRWIAALPGLVVALILALAYATVLVAVPLRPIVGLTTGLTLLVYGWAGLRLYQRFKRDPEDNLAFLLAAIVTGMLAECLLSLSNDSPDRRHVLGHVYRIGGFILTFEALFRQVARGTYIALQRAQAALRTEEERLSRIRQIARLGTWEWDLRTEVIWASEEMRRMFGLPADKTGMTRNDFENLIYRDDRERLRAVAHAALEQGAEYSIDYRVLNPDGSPHTMHSEAHIERDAAGRPLRMAGIVQDITDRVAVEHALRESDAQIRSMNVELEHRVGQRTRQLAAANKELEEFTYSVSHDLQAPLRRIERYAEMLAESNGARMDDSGRDMLRRIQEGSSHTKQLISGILKLSQVGRAELHRVSVDVSSMAGRVLEQIEHAASPIRHVEVSIEPGIVIEGDTATLQILLDNLLGNAWKFTARTERPSIRIGAVDPAEGNGFYIRDNGAGFDMRYAYKLFGAFQRLHGQEEFKGTGIGLAIVQRIVNVHGWQIHASSEIGRGATFTIKVH